MSKKTKIVLIPLLASICFILTFWLTSIRGDDTVLGVSADLAGGAVTGAGIGLMLMFLWSIKKDSDY